MPDAPNVLHGLGVFLSKPKVMAAVMVLSATLLVAGGYLLGTSQALGGGLLLFIGILLLLLQAWGTVVVMKSGLTIHDRRIAELRNLLLTLSQAYHGRRHGVLPNMIEQAASAVDDAGTRHAYLKYGKDFVAPVDELGESITQYEKSRKEEDFSTVKAKVKAIADLEADQTRHLQDITTHQRTDLAKIVNFSVWLQHRNDAVDKLRDANTEFGLGIPEQHFALQKLQEKDFAARR